MRPRPLRRRGKAERRHQPYDGGRGRGEHRAMEVGHIVRPEYSRKMARMITRLFR